MAGAATVLTKSENPPKPKPAMKPWTIVQRAGGGANAGAADSSWCLKAPRARSPFARFCVMMPQEMQMGVAVLAQDDRARGRHRQADEDVDDPIDGGRKQEGRQGQVGGFGKERALDRKGGGEEEARLQAFPPARAPMA